MLAPMLLALLLAEGSAAVAADTYLHVGATPPPHGYPEIKALSLSTTEVRVGRAVHGSVETSPNVRYVEARVEYRNVAMHEDGPGRFSLTYTVPWWLPPWLRHGYTLQIIARSIDGVETVRAIPITVR
ncbi:MAG TPA: hypothetical protein VGC96_13065 [Candidatus Elarobacter sp.]|jgi:hypothetical protein